MGQRYANGKMETLLKRGTRVPRTYTLKRFQPFLQVSRLPCSLVCCKVDPSAVGRSPQRHRIQQLAQLIDKSPAVCRSSHFSQLPAVGLELRDFGLFNGFEAWHVWIFPESALQFLISPRRHLDGVAASADPSTQMGYSSGRLTQKTGNPFATSS